MELAFWRDLSVVLLCLEGFVLLLVPGALLFFSLKGLRALEGKLREVSPNVQRVFRQVNRAVHQGADKVAAPVIKASATSAQVATIGRRTTSLLRKREAQL